MVCDNTKRRDPLLPDRYPIEDFFICDVTDAIPKDDMGSMEHPVFSLSTKPDTRVREYSHNGVIITVAPSVCGLATIHDKDILIYCISQLIAKMNVGEQPQRSLYLKARDLLIATNRKTDGRGYEQLVSALERLSSTRIKTNLKTNSEEVTEGFGLIDSWRIVRHTKSKRMLELKVNISDWIFNAILGKEILTLSRDYFRLRKPLERRMYELARKHCGPKSRWSISLEMLQKKCGSSSTQKEFKRLVMKICREDATHHHLPDYSVELVGENVVFKNRGTVRKTRAIVDETLKLQAQTYEKARRAAPGYDIYALEAQWKEFWVLSGKPALKSPDAAFIGFCRKRSEKHPI
ncbi:MAG: replication initiator protein A [Cyanobacteriota bacterium]|nr:replication initiator protein A [Cyanobacteriota bacterium]